MSLLPSLVVAFVGVHQSLSQEDAANENGRFIPINWTALSLAAAIAAASSATETRLLPVGHVPLAPCACDLTAAKCDMHCCCDADCDSGQTDVFAVPCAAQHHGRKPLCVKPLSLANHMGDGALDSLCALSSHSPHLGTFHPVVPIVSSVDKYYNLIQGDADELRVASRSYQLPLSALNLNAASAPGAADGGYAHNYPVALSNSKLAAGGLMLTLPHTLLLRDVACSWHSPVRYLHSRRARCPVFISREACESDGRIQAGAYITQRDEAKVMSQPLGAVLLEPRVTYTCGSRGKVHNIAPVDIPASNGTEEQWFAPAGTAVARTDEVSATCDTGGLVPVAKLDSTGAYCDNVVTAVRYSLVWNGSSIDSVDVRLRLDTVPLNSSISGAFVVHWQHLSAPALIAADFDNVQLPPALSASPGYLVGQPVIALTQNRLDAVRAGTLTWNAAGGHTMLSVWQPDSSGLCSKATPAAIRFGYNVTSSCKVLVKLQSFQKCGDMRQRIVDSATRILFPADFVSRIGASLPILDDDGDHYMQTIFRQNLTGLLPLASEVDSSNGTDGDQMADSSHCNLMPHRVALDILYAHVATDRTASGDINVYEIVAAYQYFTFTRWSFTAENEESTQMFMLTSAVNFHKVPAKSEPELPRYYTRRRRFHCPSFVTCWQELGLPALRRPHLPLADYAYALAMTAASFIAIAIAYVASSPWAV